MYINLLYLELRVKMTKWPKFLHEFHNNISIFKNNRFILCRHLSVMLPVCEQAIRAKCFNLIDFLDPIINLSHINVITLLEQKKLIGEYCNRHLANYVSYAYAKILSGSKIGKVNLLFLFMLQYCRRNIGNTQNAPVQTTNFLAVVVETILDSRT